MAFCAQCGKQLPDNARFCPGCGAAAGVSENGTYTTRREEYAGTVIKCPSCGAQLSSFTAICPECGHEINSAKVDTALRDFIAKIDDVDRMIANSPEVSKTGWASWSGGKKFGWVVLNIYTFCIPLIIYLLLPLFKYNRKPRLTAAEKQKASMIENFPFPNGRESIIEALLFIQTKLDFLSSEKLNRHTAYWTRLWATKAKQLEQKAEMMLNGDAVAQEATLAETSKPTETPQPTAELIVQIEKGAVYTFGHDEFSLYCATAISDSLIKIEKWGKSLSTQKAFSNEYEVGTFRITDADCGFRWLDDEHTAFEFTLQDDDDGDFRKAKTVVFTLSGVDDDTNKGTNYDKNGVCYWYENDDWHEYRAMPLSDNLLKIECWYRGIAIGGFNYGYDVVVIDLNATVMGFEWTDEEHTAFTITLQDTQNSDLKKGTFVAFTLDK